MPIHDWIRVDAGTWHDMHHVWMAEIRTTLNSGLLPASVYAQAERRVGDYRGDVLALQSDAEGSAGDTSDGGVATTYARAFDGMPARWRQTLQPIP